MLTKKTAKTLIILTILLFAFSHADGGDDIFCVSMKKFNKKNRLFRRIRSFNFHVTNAIIHGLPYTPGVKVFAIENSINYSGTYYGHCVAGHSGLGGFDIDFLYNDFVVIKKRPGVKLDKVKVKFSFSIEEDIVDDKGNEIDKGNYTGENEVTYHFTNKDLNIHRCRANAFEN
ncbi:MAG: hypothetical protein H7843_05090 [Nitrospirota bacterium]